MRSSTRVVVIVAAAVLPFAATTAALGRGSDTTGQVQVTPAGARATAFSFSAGQLLDNDDRHDSAVPPGTSSTVRTPVSSSAAEPAGRHHGHRQGR